MKQLRASAACTIANQTHSMVSISCLIVFTFSMQQSCALRIKRLEFMCKPTPWYDRAEHTPAHIGHSVFMQSNCNKNYDWADYFKGRLAPSLQRNRTPRTPALQLFLSFSLKPFFGLCICVQIEYIFDRLKEYLSGEINEHFSRTDSRQPSLLSYLLLKSFNSHAINTICASSPPRDQRKLIECYRP